MPLYTPPADIPADLAAVAMDADAVIEDELAGLIPAPDSPYNARVLTALAKAISDAAKVMGLDLEPITYSEPEVRLEPEVVRMLAMLAAAADDYGQPFQRLLFGQRADGGTARVDRPVLEVPSQVCG